MATMIEPRTEIASPFDWLVDLLQQCYACSRYISDFPTFEDYVSDLTELDYPSHYCGATARYRTGHYLNQYIPDAHWEGIRPERNLKCHRCGGWGSSFVDGQLTKGKGLVWCGDCYNKELARRNAKRESAGG